ncbi:hypothetical protein [Nonomuraea sp. MG754425]|uniref:hypothetical protein n=1 Tax=Nonomuraea sp. MG754425 TaxID=2570319 RepID=UPI001F43ABBF|nr:hypothetical protein [Nonomuraea sp. MG754425]
MRVVRPRRARRPPVTTAALERFTAALQGLCAGGTVEYREGDRVRDIRLLHAGPHVNTTDPSSSWWPPPSPTADEGLTVPLGRA